MIVTIHSNDVKRLIVKRNFASAVTVRDGSIKVEWLQGKVPFGIYPMDTFEVRITDEILESVTTFDNGVPGVRRMSAWKRVRPGYTIISSPEETR